MIEKIIYKYKIKFFGTIFILFIVYFCLISLDWCVKVYVNMNKLKPIKEAEKIEKDYKKTIPAKAQKKRDQGFSPMFSPSYFNKKKEYNSLYKKYSTLPLGVLPNKKYYVCDEGYGLTTFTSDKFGFWNSNKIYNKKVDIMIIGDSLSMNGCLQEEETFIGMLRKNYNVMNLSISANDPIHYASVAKVFIPEFKPKIVLMVFNRGDFIDHYSQKTHIYKENFFEKKVAYFEDEKNFLNFPEKYNKSLLNLLFDAQDITEKYIGRFDDFNPAEPVSKLHRIFILFSTHYKLTYLQNIFLNKNYLPYGNKLALDALSENCDKINCSGFYAFVPGSNFWRPDSRQSKYSELLGGANKKFNNLKFINFTDDFKNLDKDAYSPKGNHLSQTGNKKIFKKLIIHFNETKF